MITALIGAGHVFFAILSLISVNNNVAMVK